MTGIADRLAELRRALADLLDALDTPSPSGGADRVVHGWQRVEAAFERCESARSSRDTRNRSALARELDEIRRLSAIVQQSAAREKRATAELLERVQDAHRKLQLDGASTRTGDSVDLAG